VRTTNSGGVWEKQVGNLHTYNDTYFTDINTGYIVGKGGIVRKTTDAGLSWSDINLNTTYSLNKVFFTSSNTGYICGDSGLVRKTTNAGLDWFSQTTPAADSSLLSIHFVNENTGYIGVFPWSILKTTNAGANWTRIYYNSQKDIAYYYDIDFWDSEMGVIAGDLGVLLTSNAGINWTRIIIPSSNLKSINYLDSSNIIAFGYADRIIKSTNSGQTWFNISNQFGATIFSSQFFGDQFGVICGDLGRVARTTNGGLNWILQEFLASESLTSLYFTDPNTGYVVGQAGQIVKTTNGGLSYIISNSELIPYNYVLHQNYPNPFNPVTTIDYELRKPGLIEINVFDVSGKFIKTLVNKFHSAGSYSLKMMADDLSSGIYFYTMHSNNQFINSKKLLIIK
ncbi:MAG: YCF48-related protein, partial [Ignavibacteria bacterium]